LKTRIYFNNTNHLHCGSAENTGLFIPIHMKEVSKNEANAMKTILALP